MALDFNIYHKRVSIFAKILFFWLLLFTWGCGNDSVKIETPTGKIIIEFSGSKNIKMFAASVNQNVTPIPIPLDVKSIKITVTGKTLVEPVIIINNVVDNALFVTLDLSGGNTYDFLANAYDDVNGLGNELYSGSVTGVVAEQGDTTIISMPLSAIGISAPAITFDVNQNINLTSSSNVIDAVIDPKGHETVAFLVWGDILDKSANTTNILEVGSDLIGQIIFEILELNPNTEYFYRVVAANSGHVVNSVTNSFTTLARFGLNQFYFPVPPAIITLPAENISLGNATLKGTVNPKGSDAGAYFEWGTDSKFLNPDNSNYEFTTLLQGQLGNGWDDIIISVNIIGLNPGETYHFRVIAYNSKGLNKGEDQIFIAE